MLSPDSAIVQRFVDRLSQRLESLSYKVSTPLSNIRWKKLQVISRVPIPVVNHPKVAEGARRRLPKD